MKKLLKETNLELLKEWDNDKNIEIGLDIDKITYASGKKAFWVCSKCGQGWYSYIYNRTLNHTGCPFCGENKKNIKVSKLNSVATKNPELIKYWDTEKNGDVTPENTCYRSHKKVWWICDKNPKHSYQKSVQEKTTGFGHCPICKREKRKEKVQKRNKDN
ncbi:zinc-ribbon domain-containing protein [Clostridium sp.]|jgi:rubrerythrin|uniref:zinc-ribbon domain-containing protein n=1 Tax=Clostridium sp. TaxID=1506 RepID=UPI00258F987A|nr:zinc-ribbon domain-containing protein [Clostridium sp.]MDF2503065.1 hypothetical protein [Clostridium sp.]